MNRMLALAAAAALLPWTAVGAESTAPTSTAPFQPTTPSYQPSAQPSQRITVTLPSLNGGQPTGTTPLSTAPSSQPSNAGPLTTTPLNQAVMPQTVSDSAPPMMNRPPVVPEAIDGSIDDPDTPQYNDLWERIRAGFRMKEIDSPLVARHEAWYLNRPDYMQRMIERGSLYLFYIVEELEKRDMPMEIALLPMIESAYNPQAYSRMRAAGLWQFIPSTGKRYGLQQNFWYDGRRDVLAATHAALDYLQFLHGMLGDWELALAAYNWGENGVARAVAKNRALRKPTDYASLKMPKETRNYLPKLQAVKNIISNPELLSFALQAVPNEPYFAVVKAPGHIDLVKAARLADMPLEDFRSLNPGYNRPVIIQAAARQIVLPIDKVDEFQANLESNQDPLVSWQTYTLKRGETLEKVAAKFGTSAYRLREVNGLTGGRNVRPGQMLLVPIEEDVGAETNLDETYSSPDFQASPEEQGTVRSYRVKRGDTLSSIARAHRTNVARIKTLNNLKSNSLRVGQRLVINGDRPVRRSAMHRSTLRRVSN